MIFLFWVFRISWYLFIDIMTSLDSYMFFIGSSSSDKFGSIISISEPNITLPFLLFIFRYKVCPVFSYSISRQIFINPLSANFTKWSNTLKQFVGNLPTHCLSVFGHFVGLALKELCSSRQYSME